MIELLESLGGLPYVSSFIACFESLFISLFIQLIISRFDGVAQGQNESHFAFRVVPPLLPNKRDWEINPYELNVSSSVRIGKVLSHALYSFHSHCACYIREHIRYLFQNLLCVFYGFCYCFLA